MNEIELLKAAQTDEYAVEELLKKYKPLVLKIARRYFLVGGDIDDLVQEGTIGLYKAIMVYNQEKEASFITFATLCIKRQLQSLVRKENTQNNSVFLDLFNDDDLNKLINIPTNKGNPEQVAISNQNLQYIDSEIKSQLSDFEYKVLQQYLNGMSYEQIATENGTNKKSIDNALSRLRAKLSHLLDDIYN